MSNLISGERLIEIVKSGLYFKNGKVSNCKGMKYDLVLSNRFLKAKFGTPVDYSKLTASEIDDEYAVVAPGEVVFVLTEETFNLPHNVYAQLSPKRNMSELGINVNGALFVDPSYNGKLVFGLYNFSSSNFPLIPGKTFASAVFNELQDGETVEYPEGKSPKPITDFSTELIAMISKCSPIGLTALSKQIDNITNELFELKGNLNENERWAKEVKSILDDISEENKNTAKNISELGRSIGDLKAGLDSEIEARKDADKDIKMKFDKNLEIEISERKDADKAIDIRIDKKMVTLQTIGYIITTIIIGGGGTLLITWLAGALNF